MYFDNPHRLAKEIKETGGYITWDRFTKPHKEIVSENATIHTEKYGDFKIKDFIKKFYNNGEDNKNNDKGSD